MKKKTLIYLILIFFSGINLFAQKTLNVTVVRGRNPSFYFTTFNRLNNGIPYPNFTEFNVSFIDSGDATNRWELHVNALTAQIDGDTYNIPLNTVRISVNSSANWVVNAGQPIDLTANPATGVLITNGQQGSNFRVIVSYDCGVAPSPALIGQSADNYYVELNFEFVSVN